MLAELLLSSSNFTAGGNFIASSNFIAGSKIVPYFTVFAANFTVFAAAKLLLTDC